MMNRGLWKIIGLCAVACVVGITAFTLDDCDPGDQPPAPNSAADADGATRKRAHLEDDSCTIGCGHPKAPWRVRNAVPRAFADKPVLARMLSVVPMENEATCGGTASCLLGSAEYLPPSEAAALTEECKSFVPHHRDDSQGHLFGFCILHAAGALDDFRATAVRESDDTRGLRAAQKQKALDIYRDAPTGITVWLKSNVPNMLTSDNMILGSLIHMVLSDLEMERLMAFQLECGFDEQSIVPRVGPKTTACLKKLAQAIAFERAWHASYLTRTGSAAVCERVGGPVADGDIPYELGWYGPNGTPMSDPPRGIVRKDN